MNIKRSFWLRFAAGFPMGIATCLIIVLCMTGFVQSGGKVHFDWQPFFREVCADIPRLMLHLLVSGVFGALVMGATVAYEVEKWSILQSTLVHFCSTVVLYYITAFSLGWLSVRRIGENLIVLSIFIVVYALIWLINYLKYKAQIKAMNRELEKIKKDDTEQQ